MGCVVGALQPWIDKAAGQALLIVPAFLAGALLDAAIRRTGR